MTRKDYEAIARTILSERARAEARETDISKVIDSWVTLGLLAVNLATTLGHGNPRFDRARFLEACGMSADEIATATERQEAHRRQVIASLKS